MMLEKGKCDWCLGGYETILIIINILHVHVCVLCNKILLSVLFMITWIPFCFLHSKAKLQLIWQKNMVTKKSFHYWEILKKRKRSVFYEPYNFCHFSTELFSFQIFPVLFTWSDAIIYSNWRESVWIWIWFSLTLISFNAS